MYGIAVTEHVAAVHLPMPVPVCVCLFVSFVLFAYSIQQYTRLCYMPYTRCIYFRSFPSWPKIQFNCAAFSGSRIALLLLLFTHFKHFHNLLEIDEDRMWYSRTGDERR